MYSFFGLLGDLGGVLVYHGKVGDWGQGMVEASAVFVYGWCGWFGMLFGSFPWENMKFLPHRRIYIHLPGIASGIQDPSFGQWRSCLWDALRDIWVCWCPWNKPVYVCTWRFSCMPHSDQDSRGPETKNCFFISFPVSRWMRVLLWSDLPRFLINHSA